MNTTVSGYDPCGAEPVFPRDIFSNRFIYNIATHKVTSTIIFCEILLIVVLVLLNTHNDIALAGISALGFSLLLVNGIIVSNMSERFIVLGEANELALLKEVTTVKPGLDMIKWDLIASELNLVIKQNSSSTPYFFYDGEACVDYFKKRFLDPYFKRKEKRDAASQQVGSSEGQSTPVACDQLDPFVERAVTAYEESLEAYWNELMGDNSPV